MKNQSAQKVVFLFGGPSPEHEVSVATAKSALPNFAPDYVILPVFITKQGQWAYVERYNAPHEAWPCAKEAMQKPGVPADVALDYLTNESPDVVFLGLHGTFGEDGTVQTLLDAHGLPYTGSDAEASALAIDKPKVLQILQDEGLDVPEFLEVDNFTRESDMVEFIEYHHYPVVVLPADSGSSVGVSIVHNQQQLAPALTLAKKQSDRVLISAYVAGREVSCGILAVSQTEIIALPPTELIPTATHEFFDYDAKYVPGEAQEITPPQNIDVETIKQIQHLAKRVHQIIGADGFSRVDMIVGQDKTIYILEINTLPGLTETSILPQEAKAHGLSFNQLLTTICQNVDKTDKDFITAAH